MMIHRHFEGKKNKNITTLEDVKPRPFNAQEQREEYSVAEVRPKRNRGKPYFGEK